MTEVDEQLRMIFKKKEKNIENLIELDLFLHIQIS
jgi:hypothetical protein